MEDTKFYRNKENQGLEHWECWGRGVGEIALTKVSFFFCLGKCVTISTCLIIIYIKNIKYNNLKINYINVNYICVCIYTHTFDHYSQILYL